MWEDEQLLAEQTVATGRSQALMVRISRHQSEDFYRVQVASPLSPERCSSTTVSPGENFMVHLIEAAVSGESVAWSHLAQWGQDRLVAPTLAPRRRFG